MSEKDERQLVAGCIANDRRCQEALYRKHFHTMFGLVSRYASDEQEALFILNQGFLRVFQKIHLFGFRGSLEGWIRRLVFHSISDHFRKKNRQIHFLDVDEMEPAIGEQILPPLFEADLLQLVDDLPDATRNVFQLYALEGYTHPEIAQQLGISVGTSKWHLSEARKRLKKAMINSKEFSHYVRKTQ